MTWFDYLLIGWVVFGSLLIIGQVGKPRKPIDNATAVSSTVINGLLILALLFSRGVFS